MDTRPKNSFLQQEDCFFKLEFTSKQIAAIRTLYAKHIEPAVKNFQYIGYAIPIKWNSDIEKLTPAYETYNGTYQKTDPMIGYIFNQLQHDLLWLEFDDIRPYMSRGGSLTIMPPHTVMIPHCDRPSRSCTIFFPISLGDENCINDFYYLPKNSDEAKINSTHEIHIPAFSYRMMNSAHLMNPHEWHGVRNYSRSTRIVLGWDCRTGNEQKSFRELVEIFKKLGYIKDVA